ncbi:hypothetical protein ACFTSD_01590 [Nocardiaceae bacterium NPDC056970]
MVTINATFNRGTGSLTLYRVRLTVNGVMVGSEALGSNTVSNSWSATGISVSGGDVVGMDLVAGASALAIPQANSTFIEVTAA